MPCWFLCLADEAGQTAAFRQESPVVVEMLRGAAWGPGTVKLAPPAGQNFEVQP